MANEDDEIMADQHNSPSKKGFECAAKYCKNNQQNSKYHFFRFPKNKERAMIWALACKREDLLNNVERLYYSQRLCGYHFDTKMFTNDQCNRLYYYAIPVFDHYSGPTILDEHNYSLLSNPCPDHRPEVVTAPVSISDEEIIIRDLSKPIIQPVVHNMSITTNEEMVDENIVKPTSDKIVISQNILKHPTNLILIHTNPQPCYVNNIMVPSNPPKSSANQIVVPLNPLKSSTHQILVPLNPPKSSANQILIPLNPPKSSANQILVPLNPPKNSANQIVVPLNPPKMLPNQIGVPFNPPKSSANQIVVSVNPPTSSANNIVVPENPPKCSTNKIVVPEKLPKSSTDKIRTCEKSTPINVPLSITCTPDLICHENINAFNESDLLTSSNDKSEEWPVLPVAAKSCVQTQTAMSLSAHSPRKEKMRAVLNELRVENRKLMRRNHELEVKFKKMEEFIALEQYKSLLDFAVTIDKRESKRRKYNDILEPGEVCP